MKKEMTYAIIAIALLVVVMGFCGCARVNKLNFTKDGVITTTRGEVSIECELLPDGTRKAKFSSKKGMSLWEKIAGYIRPDKLEFTGGGK